MAPSSRQPLNGQGVLRITRPNSAMVKKDCHSLSHAKSPKPETKQFGIWNVGTLTGRSGEIAEVLERRRIKVCCVQETWWKKDRVRVIRTATGEKYKLLWKVCAEGLNGVGVIIAEEFIDKVVKKVVRVYDILMMVMVLVRQCLVNIVSAYAPQVDRSQDEKDEFWEAL